MGRWRYWVRRKVRTASSSDAFCERLVAGADIKSRTRNSSLIGSPLLKWKGEMKTQPPWFHSPRVKSTSGAKAGLSFRNREASLLDALPGRAVPDIAVARHAPADARVVFIGRGAIGEPESVRAGFVAGLRKDVGRPHGRDAIAIEAPGGE